MVNVCIIIYIGKGLSKIVNDPLSFPLLVNKLRKQFILLFTRLEKGQWGRRREAKRKKMWKLIYL